MTTIAYRDGIMACDSQITSGDIKYARAKKIRKLGCGALVGVCGDWFAAWKLMEGIRDDGTIPGALLDHTKGASGLFILPDGSTWLLQGGKNGGLAPVENSYLADGSGYVAAMAAMMGGADAAMAVKVACAFDVNSGMPVHVEKLGMVAKPKGLKGRKGK